jgi:hypothetical protein
MKAFIAAARQRVEQDTGLALITQTRAVTMTLWPGNVIPLPSQAMPLQSITDPAGNQLTKEQVIFDRQLGLLTVPGAYDWPESTWTIVAGWLDAATLLAEAPMLWQCVALVTAHLATAGRDMVVDSQAVPVPFGYDDMIQPFRLMWVI